VLVSKDATIEAEAEKMLDSCSLLDVAEGLLRRSSLRHMGEEVFIAQLHRRALLLNDGFQDQIRQVLSHYESMDRVKSKDSRFQSDPNSTDMRFSADIILKTSSTDSFARASNPSISERSWRTADAAVVLLECIFDDGVGAVELHQAPIKT
jgi:hypothetical protein